MIQRRLAQLSPAARELVGLAAVVGREFRFEILARASETGEATLLQALDEAWQRRIVREHTSVASGPQDLYDFSHDKLREVAYAALGRARRRRLHHRVAQALEGMYAPDTDTVSGQLAYHNEQAGQVAPAVMYYQQAVEVAQRVLANKEAIRYGRRALALLVSAGWSTSDEWSYKTSQLYENLGDLLHLTGEYDAAREAFESALGLYGPADRIRLARLRHKIGNTWREQYQYASALAAYAQAVETLGTEPGSIEWRREWITLQQERTSIHYWLAQPHEAMVVLDEMLPHIETYATPMQRVDYLLLRNAVQLQQSRYIVSAAIVAGAKAALAAAQEAGLTRLLPATLFRTSWALMWGGEVDEAEANMQRALRLAEEADDISLQARCLTYLTMVYRRRGDVDQTRRHAARALRVSESAHMPEYVAAARAHQAWLAWRAGDLAEVERHGRAALALWGQLPLGHPSAVYQWTALWPLIGAALHVGDIAQAVDHARTLLHPKQQRLADDVAAPLADAIQAADGGDLRLAHRRLIEAAGIAEGKGFF